MRSHGTRSTIHAMPDAATGIRSNGDRLFCVYLAEGEDAIREHGRRGGFPVDGVYQVTGAFDPTTAAATAAS